MTEKQAIIFELDVGDRVIAVKEGRRWQPTYEERSSLAPLPEGGVWTAIYEVVAQSTALWTLRDLRQLCAGDAEAVRRALVGGES